MTKEAHDDLYKIRHSLAHVLAQAILKLYPETNIAIGPPIDTGCYYDLQLAQPISDADFKAIEKQMRSIINQGQTFAVDELSIADAIAYWQEQNQPFKVELIEDLAKAGETTVTHYKNVNNDGETTFTDLCKGGHVENLNEIPADGFKIMSIAGAYWRGDESREQLTRVYLAAFSSKEALKEHLTMLEEAKKRDHRKLGQELDLFTFSELVGPGLPLWTPRGTLVRNLLDQYVWELRESRGYEKVSIPHITKKDLYETSGHWQKFSDELFKITTREGHEFAMKPMNCPHHTQIFSSQQRSYKHMPKRYAETTVCYRDEQSGELHGLSRVRSFAQDDAHVFCRQNQVKAEFLKIWDIIDTFYSTVGFKELQVRLSLHDPAAPEKYLGTPELWQTAEQSLRELAQEREVVATEEIGEAAFYGPKVDFVTKDSIGREWQVATIQLDVNMPDKFNLFCINETGEQERIVMIHAAIMGSLERFLSIYLEHIAGVFPLWLAPTQIGLMPVAGAHEQYTNALKAELEDRELRTEFFESNDSLGKRIRNGEKQKIPYLLVLGDTEVANNSVTVRNLKTKEQITMLKEEFIRTVQNEVTTRALEYTIG